MGNTRYTMSFTTGGLFLQESLKMATLYLESKDWIFVQQKVISDNLLQSRTLSTSKRNCREILSRLKTLNQDEIDLFIHCSHLEQGYILWIAICRRYRFIADFAIEVLRERYISLKTDLNYEDFDSFFNKKSDWHSELEKIRSVSRKKLRQVLFKIMREAELRLPDHTINGVIFSPSFFDVISSKHQQDLLFFPIFDADLMRMAK